MPPNRRSKVHRLPKAERTHPTPKVSVFPPPTSSPPSPLPPPPPPPPPPPSSPPRRPHRHSNPDRPAPPSLPHDVWRKIIFHAGTPSALSCLTVCTHLRRAARAVLSELHVVHLSRIFSPPRSAASSSAVASVDSPIAQPVHAAHVPSLIRIQRALESMPNMHTLVLSRWPYTTVYPNVVDDLATSLASASLRVVSISGLQFSSKAFITWMDLCPNLDSLILGSHASVSDVLCVELAGLSFHKNFSRRRRVLRALSLSNTRTLTSRGVNMLLSYPTCHELTVSHAPAVRHVHVGTQMDKQVLRLLSLESCLGLLSLGVGAEEDSGVRQVSLTGCPSLRDVNLGASGRGLQRLTVSGCRSLMDIAGVAGEVVLGEVEEVNLFGARRLSEQTYDRFLGITRADVALKKLKRLILNGSSVERVVLHGYDRLEEVDLSGSAVKEVEVRDCWALKRFAAQGRDVNLRRLDMMVGMGCTVEGVRTGWRLSVVDGRKCYLLP